ncbi:MAG TPA: hypothetical protein VEE82_02755, partial [Thermodesulfovibrionales bacterium]|nr:hypothetical protein [Thermodesulfovibrionales bacterium]
IVQKHKVDIVPSKDEGITVKIPEKDQFETGETVVPCAPVAVEAVTPRNVPQAKDEKPSPVRPVPLGVGALLYDEKLASLASSLSEVSQSLSGIKETLSVLYRETKESGRQHMDALRILREISASQAENKKKRRWFNFFPR